MLMASTVLALGLGLVAVASTERAMAGNSHAGTAVLYAAEALAEYVLTELSSDSSWTPALTGERLSAFLEPTTQPVAPWNESLDLAAMTVGVQQQSDGVWSAGADTPGWQLFAAGPIARLVASELADSMFVMAWVADDTADADGNPKADANGILMVRVHALALGGLQRILLIVLQRDDAGGPGNSGPPAVRVVSWREVR